MKTCSFSSQRAKSQIEATIIYPSTTVPPQRNRTVFYLEARKTVNPLYDISITDGSTALNMEKYEYNNIQSPQMFPGDLHLDWRTFNLVLWSKCYCRYDKNNMPTLSEQQLSLEINSLKASIDKMRTKSRQQIILDTFRDV